eukprot:CAMPEP_0203765986 /NCGR_PEP_ID=MMETSP0099_2-20121227/164_1 /ASSEMBLY_ACC=CAM_ASM_000209 /TAXON_ID=96639 /ORGANISM=" , Strain NY0313808BC1" /LENGTH=316 /DNA_ID=CAMNT_0050662281 /DNA_START=25 /DNA_END=972 /DNA_ORIENTATION=-
MLLLGAVRKVHGARSRLTEVGRGRLSSSCTYFLLDESKSLNGGAAVRLDSRGFAHHNRWIRLGAREKHARHKKSKEFDIDKLNGNLKWEPKGEFKDRRTILKKAQALKGFRELDLLALKPLDSSERVHIHNRERLKRGIPKPTPDEGKPLSRGQLRSSEALLKMLDSLIVDRKFYRLDEEVCEIMGTYHALIEITRVEVTADYQEVVVHWIHPVRAGVDGDKATQEEIDALSHALWKNRGSIKNAIVQRLKKPKAANISFNYDKEYLESFDDAEVIDKKIVPELETGEVNHDLTKEEFDEQLAEIEKEFERVVGNW